MQLRNLPARVKRVFMVVMAAYDPDLEVELELFYAYEPDLEVELELVTDDLAHPWFELGESEAQLAAIDAEVFEIDPIHPLRRLGSWMRARLAS